jgi:hypothetical protein
MEIREVQLWATTCGLASTADRRAEGMDAPQVRDVR